MVFPPEEGLSCPLVRHGHVAGVHVWQSHVSGGVCSSRDLASGPAEWPCHFGELFGKIRKMKCGIDSDLAFPVVEDFPCSRTHI